MLLAIPLLDKATSLIKRQALDDAVDRLNYFFTSMLLIFFTIALSTKQLFGSPIQCVIPHEMRSGWEEYIEDYCFVSNSYIIEFDGTNYYAPRDTRDRENSEIKYYQWVPVILALQALLFYLPNWLWRMLQKQSGLDMNITMADVQRVRTLKGTDRDQELELIAENLAENLDVVEGNFSSKRFACFRLKNSCGSYVTMLYLFIKVLYVLNIIVQFHLLDKFLSNDHLGNYFGTWGFDVLRGFFRGDPWVESDIFPRVTFCDFVLAKLKQASKYTVQCVLMINMWNEKIYLFMWFWLVFIGISTAVNFLYCTITLLMPCFRIKNVNRLLKHTRIEKTKSLFANKQEKTAQNMEKVKERIVFDFTWNGLQSDGVLILRFIETHAGTHIAREICAKMLRLFLKTQSEAQAQHVATPDSTIDTSISNVSNTSTESEFKKNRTGKSYAIDFTGLLCPKKVGKSFGTASIYPTAIGDIGCLEKYHSGGENLHVVEEMREKAPEKMVAGLFDYTLYNAPMKQLMEVYMNMFDIEEDDDIQLQ